MTLRARLLAAVIAAAAFVAVTTARAQQPGPGFTVKASARGGTVAAPKAVGLRIAYSAGAGSSGLQAPPTKAYTMLLGRIRISPSILPSCTAAAMNAAQTNTRCRAGSKIGSGTITALIGTTGTPVANASECRGVLSLYAAGRGRAAMWFDLSPDTGCIGVVAKAVTLVVTRPRSGSRLQLTLPDDLRHLADLDVSVTGFTVDLARIVRVRGRFRRRTGYVESVCASRRRSSTITVLSETGAASLVKGTGAC